MFYKECPQCGANLDPGETCDCGKRKEACSEATEQTSSALNATKPYPYYTTDKEECQDVRTDTSGNTSS